VVAPKSDSLAVQKIMWQVNLALLPGVIVALYYYGFGYAQNLLLAIPAGLAFEAFALRLRHRDWRQQPLDGSVVLTCALIALAAPPAVAPFALLAATAVAVLLAKHAFGGVGRNLFNPAMAGYAAALVSFPAAFANWPVPTDGVTAATVLDSVKTLDGLTMADRAQDVYGFGQLGGYGAEHMGAAFALGGLWLLWKQLAAWRVCAGFLLAILCCSVAGYDNGSSTTGGSPGLHLFGGGTLLAAFFVVTDPVTHPARHQAQWLFGVLAALLTYLIRIAGAYPDGIAFAILLANAAAPLLNQWAARFSLRREQL